MTLILSVNGPNGNNGRHGRSAAFSGGGRNGRNGEDATDPRPGTNGGGIQSLSIRMMLLRESILITIF